MNTLRQSVRATTIIFGVGAFITLLSGCPGAGAQPPSATTTFVYPVRTVCRDVPDLLSPSIIDTSTSIAPPLDFPSTAIPIPFEGIEKDGSHLTTILTMYNPSAEPVDVTVKKMPRVGTPTEDEITIAAEGILGLACPLFNPDFDDGFVILESTEQLVVTATYIAYVVLERNDTKVVPAFEADPSGSPEQPSGAGIGAGVGRGIGTGTGISIDVEYIEPITD